MAQEVVFYSVGVDQPISHDEPLPPLPAIRRVARVVVGAPTPIWRYGVVFHRCTALRPERSQYSIRGWVPPLSRRIRQRLGKGRCSSFRLAQKFKNDLCSEKGGRWPRNGQTYILRSTGKASTTELCIVWSLSSLSSMVLPPGTENGSTDAYLEAAMLKNRKLPAGTDQLFAFLQSRWEEIVIMGIWLPVVIMALTTGIAPFIASLIGGALVIVALHSLLDKLRQRRQPMFGGEASGITRKGLIFTVGHQAETIEYAFGGQQPQWVGFLCTEQTIDVADRLVRSLRLSPDRWRREIVDPRDIADVRTKTHSLIDWLVKQGLRTEQIALDPTGGMTPMSLGAYSVAQERQVDSQYVRSRYDDNNQPIRGTQELIFLGRHSTPSRQ